MKRLFTVILALVVLLSATASAELLSDTEEKFVGGWTMYADNGKGTIYNIVVTFLDNLEVVQRTMIFENGVLKTDNKASGEWCGFTDNAIVFKLADSGMMALIKDDGYLYMYFYDDLSLCGIFSRSQDMTSILGW